MPALHAIAAATSGTEQFSSERYQPCAAKGFRLGAECGPRQPCEHRDMESIDPQISAYTDARTILLQAQQEEADAAAAYDAAAAKRDQTSQRAAATVIQFNLAADDLATAAAASKLTIVS